MSNTCKTSNDCIFGDVLKECYENNNFREEVFFCDCSNWFGWEGANCTTPTSTIYYFRLTEIFSIIVVLFLMLTSGKTLFYAVSYSRKQKLKLTKYNPIVWVE